jgi:hypothetical protein
VAHADLLKRLLIALSYSVPDEADLSALEIDASECLTVVLHTRTPGLLIGWRGATAEAIRAGLQAAVGERVLKLTIHDLPSDDPPPPEGGVREPRRHVDDLQSRRRLPGGRGCGQAGAMSLTCHAPIPVPPCDPGGGLRPWRTGKARVARSGENDMSDPSTATPADAPEGEQHERPLRTALERLVTAGTITKEQATAVRQAVREERKKHHAA